MKRIFGILAVLLLSFGATNAQTPGKNFDVTHYSIHLSDFDFTAHTLQGETSVTLTVTESTDTLVLELKSLTVTTVESSFSTTCQFSQEGDLLIVTTGAPIAAGQTGSVTIQYNGHPFCETWGGVEWWGTGYVYTLGVGFESQPHNLGKTWFPCVDNFTDKATYDLLITVDNDKKAICGGNLNGTTDNGDGTTTWHWQTPQEIATYHISFAIGNYELWEDVFHGVERDIPIQVYAKPNQINKVPGTFVHINEIAAFYETNFGPYPFNRIGYVSTGKGCMESTDNIAMASDIIDGSTSGEEYVAHELSHMYFGNQVTCATAQDMWLNEGMAQFCGLFYRVGVYGENDFQSAMSSKINTITNWYKFPNNWIPLNNIPLNITYDGSSVYDRGAVIANTMMNYMGRENFLTGLRHYLTTHAYGTASSEQLRDALSEATGMDMTGFFDTYVFTAGMPHYGVKLLETTPNGPLFDAKIQMSYWHVGPSHVGQNNRVEVTFVGADNQMVTELVGWDGLDAECTVSLEFAPIAAFVDYDNHFLDAKLDLNRTITAPTTITRGNFEAVINSVNNSVLLRIEEHFVGPDDEPDLPYLHLSTRRYWTFFANDADNANITAKVSFSNNTNQDDDIIHTENDSAVLLYRANITDTWHTIPYTQIGNWKIGKFTADNAQSGQYTIGAIDKLLFGINETNEHETRIYPNPTHGMIMGQTGEYRITNLSGQTLKKGRAQGQIDVSDLSAGTYFITLNGNTSKFIIQ